MHNGGGSKCIMRANQTSFNYLINNSLIISSLRSFIMLSLVTFMSKYSSATNALNTIFDANKILGELSRGFMGRLR